MRVCHKARVWSTWDVVKDRDHRTVCAGAEPLVRDHRHNGTVTDGEYWLAIPNLEVNAVMT